MVHSVWSYINSRLGRNPKCLQFSSFFGIMALFQSWPSDISMEAWCTPGRLSENGRQANRRSNDGLDISKLPGPLAAQVERSFRRQQEDH